MDTAQKRSSPQIFVWRRTGLFADRFALYDREHAVAVLDVGGLADYVAQLKAGDLRLVFLGEGMGSRHLRICDASTNAAVARYERNWRGSGGTLRLAEGGQLRWVRVGGLFAPDRMFVNMDGAPLVRFAADGTVANLVAGDSPAAASRDFLLVSALGWLLMLVARSEAS